MHGLALSNMKILCLTHNYSNNGAALLLLHTVRHWTAQLGWEVHAYVANDQQSQVATLRDFGAVPVSVEARNLLPSYDLVLINTLVDLHLVDRLPVRQPIALWAHEGTSIMKSMRRGIGLHQARLARLQGLILQTPFQSEVAFRELVEGFPTARITYVPNPVMPTSVAPRPGRPAGVPLKIAMTGTLCPRKNQVELAEAVLRVAAQLPVECHFIGDDETYRRVSGVDLIAPYRMHPQLVFHGDLPREQALSIVASADLFCLPSLDESFALAPLEAAALGVPVILSGLRCHDYVGWRHRENCLFYPPRTVDNLAALIVALAANADSQAALARNGARLAASMPFERYLERITQAVVDIAQRSP